MHKNTWLIIAGIIAASNLLMVTANTAIAASDLLSKSDVKQIDGRERRNVSGPGHSFSFAAPIICDEETSICISIWGSGWFNPNTSQITASGGFATSADTATLASGNWRAINLFNGSDKSASFNAATTTGVINIMLDEGSRKQPAKVCVYGSLVGIMDPNSAICSRDVSVSIM